MLESIQRRHPASACDRSDASGRRGGLAAVLMIGLGMVQAVTASVLPDFTIDLNPVSSRIKKPLLLVADKLTGNSHQVLTFNGDGTFAAEGYWDVGQVVSRDGAFPHTAEESRLGVDYALYGLFRYAGTFTIDAMSGRFVGTGGSVTLYIDRGRNTVKTLPDVAPNPVTLTKFNDDSILATASLTAGEGHFRVDPLANGDFGLLFDPVSLTSLGDRFFVAPAPWTAGVLLKGHFTTFDSSAVQHISGSADLVLTP